MFDTQEYSKRFEDALQHLVEELKKIRTGRAHPDMLAGITVMAYGQNTPLNQVATVSAPEPNQIVVTPFDPANLQDIALAIRNESALGLNPSDDGRNIRVSIPPLTEDRRRDMVKNLGAKLEEARVAIRNIRQDALKLAKQMKDDKKLSEDDVKRIEKDVDDSVADFQGQLESAVKAKEQEIMTI